MKTKTLIGLFALAVLFASWAGPKNNYGDNATTNIEKNLRTIEVTGSADVEVIPDQLELQIRISEYSHDKKESIDDIQSELTEKLEAAGITKNNIVLDDINGNNYYYWRWYWDWNYWNHSTDKPYITKMITVKIGSMAQANKVVESLHMKGISSVNMGKTSNKNIHQFRKDVKIEAMKAAKEKAEYLLESIGKKIGNVVTVKEVANDNNYNQYWYPYYNNSLSNITSNSSVGNGVVGGNGGGMQDEESSVQNIKLRYEVNVVFEIAE